MWQELKRPKLNWSRLLNFENSRALLPKLARIPKGVLLGPPGTVLAKSCIEAGASFSASPAPSLWNYLWVGAARVRDLFEQAKKQAPLHYFYPIGCDRQVPQQRFHGGNDEREQTLNQLLTEMDGFAVGDATVIVLAATNPRKFDALLRPGVLIDKC